MQRFCRTPALYFSALALAMLCACCSNTRPDATAAVRDGVAAGGGKTEQSMAHLGVGGLAIAEDGSAFGGATTRLGVDVQGAATAAGNPVTIGPLTGGAAHLLQTVTPEEKALGVRLARLQKFLDEGRQLLSIATPEQKPGVLERIAQMEGQESLAMARLREIREEKLKAAASLGGNLSNLRSVWYSIYAPQITTSGKAMTDAQTDAVSAGFAAWIAAQQEAQAAAKRDAAAAREGG